MQESGEAKYHRELEGEIISISEVILTKVCNKAVRLINKWPKESLLFADDFPSDFNFFDILSVDFQNMIWDEINPDLQNALENLLYQIFEELPESEQFFILNRECYTKQNVLEQDDVINLLLGKFVKRINNHYSSSKKIENFELKKSF